MRSWEGVVELKTSCRHWQSESQDSALNLDPLDRTRFSRHEIPDLVDFALFVSSRDEAHICRVTQNSVNKTFLFIFNSNEKTRTHAK